MMHNRADLFRWSRDKAQHLNKHNKQSQRIGETLINTVTGSTKTGPKVAKKFKRISSIKIWLSKNNAIPIHQYFRMSQFKSKCKYMFISGHFHLLGMRKTRSIFLCCDWKAWAAVAQRFTLWQQERSHIVLILLLLVRATYIWVWFFMPIPFVVNCTLKTSQPRGCNSCSKVELDLLIWLRVKETSNMQNAVTKNSDISNLQSNLLKKHWTSFSNLSAELGVASY